MNPEVVVRAHLESWPSLDLDRITEHLADDATFFPGFGFPTYSGIEQIRTALDGFLKVLTQCEVEIINLAVVGDVVLTERVDHMIYKGKQLDAAGMGAFEVSGDEITAWRDYFYAGDHD